MQTFLPLPSFDASARCLDRLRLGKQRVECLQIINTLTGKSKGWHNHPAVRMWSADLPALRTYGLSICLEWERRGYENGPAMEAFLGQLVREPTWITHALCASHRSNLLRKDPVHYGQFGWTEPTNLPYFWPTQEAA